MARTTARLDPAAEAQYPIAWPSRVRVSLRNGQTVTAEVDNPKGDPENPLTRAEAEAKFRGMLAGTPFAARAEALIQLVEGLPNLPSLHSAFPSALGR